VTKCGPIVHEQDYFAKDTIGKQMERSADSIQTNIAEGYGRYHYKGNRNFCYFSRGSISETKDYVNKSKTRELLTGDQFNLLFEKLQIIHLKLNAYLKFIGKSDTDKADRYEPMNYFFMVSCMALKNSFAY
jgi:four helix bundle protein